MNYLRPDTLQQSIRFNSRHRQKRGGHGRFCQWQTNCTESGQERTKDNAMPQLATVQGSSHLSYLEASKVNSPAGALADLDLVRANGQRVGRIAGVVIDSAARCVRYFDVQSAGWRRRHYLVAADQLAQLDPAQPVLRLLDNDLTEVRDLNPATLHRYSDDDLLAAMFSARVA
jgi:hypothetical protein